MSARRVVAIKRLVMGGAIIPERTGEAVLLAGVGISYPACQRPRQVFPIGTDRFRSSSIRDPRSAATDLSPFLYGRLPLAVSTARPESEV
jgi:hypothetical protein